MAGYEIGFLFLIGVIICLFGWIVIGMFFLLGVLAYICGGGLIVLLILGCLGEALVQDETTDQAKSPRS
jgi:hypothetical protein